MAIYTCYLVTLNMYSLSGNTDYKHWPYSCYLIALNIFFLLGNIDYKYWLCSYYLLTLVICLLSGDIRVTLAIYLAISVTYWLLGYLSNNKDIPIIHTSNVPVGRLHVRPTSVARWLFLF